MKLIPYLYIVSTAVNLVSGELLQINQPLHSKEISSELNLTTCYNVSKKELNEIASNEWSHIHQNFSTTLYKFEELADELLIEGINDTNCIKESKRLTIEMILAAIEKNDRMLSDSLEKIEKIFYNEIWGLEMQTDWPDCYKKPPLIRKILMCIDQDVLQNPTVDKLIKHRNFVNLTRFSSESVISEMKKSLNIIKLSRNSSIELQKREFDSCIHQTRISAVFNYFKTDSTTQRSRNETASTKEINFKNPTETQRSVWQGIDTKLSLKIRNTNIYTSSSFHNILEQMVDNGKNVTCCYKPAMEHVNNATQRAQIELSQCFKNQSYEFQISIIIEISNIKIEKSFFDKCVQADILLNASSKENFVRCLDYDVTNKNVFQKFDAKVEAYMQSHRGLLENCLKIVMANYRDSVTHGYIKFDSCLENQKTKQCNPRIATNPDRSIQILLKNSFDDKYDWVLWDPNYLSWVPRLG